MTDYLTQATELLQRTQETFPQLAVDRALIILSLPNPTARDRIDAARELSGAAVAAAAYGQREHHHNLRRAQRLVQLSARYETARVVRRGTHLH